MERQYKQGVTQMDYEADARWKGHCQCPVCALIRSWPCGELPGRISSMKQLTNTEVAVSELGHCKAVK